MLDHLTKKAGEFRATCRKGAYLLLEQMTPEERIDLDRRIAEAEARGEYTGMLQRWDKGRKAEVGLVECTLATTDREEYLAHLARFHNKRTTLTPFRNESNLDLFRRASGKWRGPKAKPEGTPVKPDVDFKTCPACGLVAEVGYRVGYVLWWDEHTRMCAGAEAGAA
jgi:hypothetical protein